MRENQQPPNQNRQRRVSDPTSNRYRTTGDMDDRIGREGRSDYGQQRSAQGRRPVEGRRPSDSQRAAQARRQASASTVGGTRSTRRASSQGDYQRRRSSGDDYSRGQYTGRANGDPNRMPNDDYQRGSKKNKKNKHTVGKVIAIIEGLLSIIVLAVLFILNVLPTMYTALICGVLVLIWIFAFFSQFTKKSHIPGKIFAVIMSIVLGFASYYLLITQNMLSQITGIAYNIDTMVVAVLADNSAQSLDDVKDYVFGIELQYDADNMNHAVEEVENRVGGEIATSEFPSMHDQIQALYDRQVGTIIYNKSFEGTIEEMFPGFTEQTRIIDNVSIRTIAEVTNNDGSDAQVTKEPFMLYISANDSYGELSVSGRSDVNMLVAVNPKTKQILMVNTPRDYYVELPGVSGGMKDKLTHAGNYGIDCSIDTLEAIYDEGIDYYIRVNFSSLIRMVDALGGITVNSDYSFTAIDGNSFVQGENYLNGEQALSFARERKNVPGGDFQRGRDQQLVLTAMINKAISPSIITGYTGIIGTISDSFVTSMDQSDITDLIKMQLNDGAQWNIVTVSALGTGDMQYCYSAPNQQLSVVIPDEASVASARTLIDQLFAGETLVQPEIKVTE